MNKYLKYCKGFFLIYLTSLFLFGWDYWQEQDFSLFLFGCGLGSDTITTGYYKDVSIKANGEFVIKDKVDDELAKKAVYITMLKSVKTVPPKTK